MGPSNRIVTVQIPQFSTEPWFHGNLHEFTVLPPKLPPQEIAGLIKGLLTIGFTLNSHDDCGRKNRFVYWTHRFAKDLHGDFAGHWGDGRTFVVEKMVDFKDFFFETSPGQSTYSPNERHPPTMSIYLLMILIGSKCSWDFDFLFVVCFFLAVFFVVSWSAKRLYFFGCCCGFCSFCGFGTFHKMEGLDLLQPGVV